MIKQYNLLLINCRKKQVRSFTLFVFRMYHLQCHQQNNMQWTMCLLDTIPVCKLKETISRTS